MHLFQGPPPQRIGTILSVHERFNIWDDKALENACPIAIFTGFRLMAKPFSLLEKNTKKAYFVPFGGRGPGSEP